MLCWKKIKNEKIINRFAKALEKAKKKTKPASWMSSRRWSTNAKGRKKMFDNKIEANKQNCKRSVKSKSTQSKAKLKIWKNAYPISQPNGKNVDVIFILLFWWLIRKGAEKIFKKGGGKKSFIEEEKAKIKKMKTTCQMRLHDALEEIKLISFSKQKSWMRI